MRTAKEIARLAQVACVREVCAPKPGNVNREHDFTDASLEEFLLSALAIGPAFENAPRAGVGQIILQAVADTRRVAGTNTNLGMILLFAPLVKACVSAAGTDEIRERLGEVLNALTVEDARTAYAAIRLAQPGGLGRVPEADINEEPSVSLLQAMVLAKDRDSIAREYATGFEVTFEIGLPALNGALSGGAGFSDAIVQAYLTILSRVPDTLIARKTGGQTARKVSQRAAEVLVQGGVFTSRGRAALRSMDAALRDPGHSLNPGTTADLVAAAVFLSSLET